jgi:hypothetical protein
MSSYRNEEGSRGGAEGAEYDWSGVVRERKRFMVKREARQNCYPLAHAEPRRARSMIGVV